MRISRGLTLLALLQSIVVFADNYHNTTDRNVQRKVSHFILHKLRKRENPCSNNEYLSDVRCCQKCDPGTYAKSDCREEHGIPDCQTCTEGSTYMDERSGYHECHKCLQCDAESGQETQVACKTQQNTVCKCAKGFFCAENSTTELDGCRQCRHCTQCKHYTESCSATRDAVCKPSRNHYIVVVLGVSTLLVLGWLAWQWLITGLVFCLQCYANMTCQPQPEPPIPPNLDEFKDIDLKEYLLEFSEKMNVGTVLSVVRKMGFPEPKIDAIQLDYKDQSQEKKYQLLMQWYQTHGRIGAFQILINTLQSISKHVAEQLIQIVESKRQQS